MAHRMSAHNTSAKSWRALDILHVAAAAHLRVDGFLTFDQDQGKLAEAEDMTIAPI